MCRMWFRGLSMGRDTRGLDCDAQDLYAAFARPSSDGSDADAGAMLLACAAMHTTPTRLLATSARLSGLLLGALIAAGCTAARAPAESPFDSSTEHSERRLFIAGGALPVCSSLSRRTCGDRFKPTAQERSGAHYRISQKSMQDALSADLWSKNSEALRQAISRSLSALAQRHSARDFSATEIEDALFTHCMDGDSKDANPCLPGELSAWAQLTDAERGALLSALQLPQLDEAGSRMRERVDLAATAEPGGVAVLRAFVEAAARGRNAPPRIAVVTASALDPFDAVDFYLGSFQALGAEPQWWPLDAALARAIEDGRACAELDALRRSELKLAGRERVYPDLAAVQRAACANPQALTRLPDEIDGVFFAGGDQWRLRRAFFDRGDQPLPWLRALRSAHARGALVVGGTSAGAAVQSGAAMLSNGSPESALREPGLAMMPPEPGCGRGARCGEGIDEDRLSFWPAGGLGLARDAVVDTHFSERAREPRLLRMLAQTGALIGFGADEASALEVIERSGAREVRAHGRSGGWVFLRNPDTGPGSLAATVFYLAPGARLELSDPATARLRTAAVLSCADSGSELNDERSIAGDASSIDAGSASVRARDALAEGATRAMARAGTVWRAGAQPARGRRAVAAAAPAFHARGARRGGTLDRTSAAELLSRVRRLHVLPENRHKPPAQAQSRRFYWQRRIAPDALLKENRHGAPPYLQATPVP
jgi:cyanophycinase